MSPNRKKTVGKNPVLRHDLIEKIKELHYIRRLSMQQVADALGISKRTVLRYCKEIDKELEQTITEMDLRDIIKKRLINHNRAIRKLWSAYDSEPAGRERARVIHEIEAQNSQHIVDMGKLGVMPLKAEEHKFDVMELKWVDPDEKKTSKKSSKRPVQTSRKTKDLS